MELRDVEKLAELARLDMPREEKETLLSDLQKVLEYVGQIEKAEAKEPKSEKKTYNFWREDEVNSTKYRRDGIVGQFPATEEDYLKVKKIL